MKNIIVIIGTLSGFGTLAARTLAQKGQIVYASMRETISRNAPQVKEVEEYAAAHGVDLHAIELNVLSQVSNDAAVKTIISKNGRLDVVIHNAGTWSLVLPRSSHRNNWPNYTILMYVLSTQSIDRTALPYFRRQKNGFHNQNEK
jgi:NADP-dependent 3-hydroxy acid dehydrogenase YdfG